jgi:putative DNA primase/helicase
MTATGLIDPRLIEAARAADIVALAKHRLGARLKPVRAVEWKWAGPCPGCGGVDRFSLNKERRIFNCRRSGGGDAIAMVQHALGLNFLEAVEFITGEKRVTSATREVSNNAPPKSPASDADKSDKARWLWRQRQPIVEGRPPWVYLRQVRGYLGPVPATLGLPTAKGGHPPSMIAAYGLASEPEPRILAISDADVRAVHVTRLALDVTAKAGGKDSKITIGPPLGSPIVLAPPNDGLCLAITEGIEDGLSVYAATGMGVWAAGSAAYMPALADRVPAWMDCVTVVGDRDEDGVPYATKLATKLKARGVETRLTFLEGAPA